MNREIKCRIRLQEKETGEKLTLFNSIFDAMIGVAWFEIDRNKWAFLGADEFTGLLDKNGKEIYEGDVVEYGSCEMQVVYRFNRFIFEGIKDKEQGISIVTGYEKFEIIGNIYETPPYIGTK